MFTILLIPVILLFAWAIGYLAGNADKKMMKYYKEAENERTRDFTERD